MDNASKTNISNTTEFHVSYHHKSQSDGVIIMSDIMLLQKIFVEENAVDVLKYCITCHKKKLMREKRQI